MRHRLNNGDACVHSVGTTVFAHRHNWRTALIGRRALLRCGSPPLELQRESRGGAPDTLQISLRQNTRFVAFNCQPLRRTYFDLEAVQMGRQMDT